MAKTVPNQNIVIIKKTESKNDFLQINNKEWMQAAIDCDKSFNAFKIYLYLAANEVGYEKALSKQAIQNAIGVKQSSYYESLEKLKELGYLVDLGGNKLEFHSTPFRQSGNNINSAATENSVRMEKVEKNKDSARMENSASAEKVYETFNF